MSRRISSWLLVAVVTGGIDKRGAARVGAEREGVRSAVSAI